MKDRHTSVRARPAERTRLEKLIAESKIFDSKEEPWTIVAAKRFQEREHGGTWNRRSRWRCLLGDGRKSSSSGTFPGQTWSDA
jgi:hypothetical protein